MLTQMVDQLIQQEPTLLAQRTVDTRRYIMDQWDRTHRDPIDENALAVFLCDETHRTPLMKTLWRCSSVMKRTAACPRNKRYSPERSGQR